MTLDLEKEANRASFPASHRTLSICINGQSIEGGVVSADNSRARDVPRFVNSSRSFFAVLKVELRSLGVYVLSVLL